MDDSKGMIIAALLVALALFGGAFMLSQSPAKIQVSNLSSTPNVYVSSLPAEHAISVTGSSTRVVSPDLLEISLRISTNSKTAKNSQSDNAQVLADLKAKLLGVGLIESDIKTVSYSVSPVYKSVYKCPRVGSNADCYYDSELDGYTTTHSLQLRVTNLAKGGEIIDVASTSGVNQTFVDGIYFTLKDETKKSIETELLSLASSDALSKAQRLASGTGAAVGKLLSISESYSYNYPQPIYYARDSFGGVSEAAAPTSLSGGTTSVSVSVSAQYQIN